MLRSANKIQTSDAIVGRLFEQLETVIAMTASTEAKVWADEVFLWRFLKTGTAMSLVNGEVRDIGNFGMEHGEIGAYLVGLLAIYLPKTN